MLLGVIVYANANPTKYTDPTGHDVITDTLLDVSTELFTRMPGIDPQAGQRIRAEYYEMRRAQAQAEAWTGAVLLRGAAIVGSLGEAYFGGMLAALSPEPATKTLGVGMFVHGVDNASALAASAIDTGVVHEPFTTVALRGAFSYVLDEPQADYWAHATNDNFSMVAGGFQAH